MRVVIDINDNLIARWGSLFVHPLGYNTESVRLYVPGFEYAAGQGQDAFKVTILPDSQQGQQAPRQHMPQQSTLPQQPVLPQDYPPPQVPQGGYQPPMPTVPPQGNVTPGKHNHPVENRDVKTSSQQPTPSDQQPLSIVTPDKENKVPDDTNTKPEKGAFPKEESLINGLGGGVPEGDPEMQEGGPEMQEGEPGPESKT